MVLAKTAIFIPGNQGKEKGRRKTVFSVFLLPFSFALYLAEFCKTRHQTFFLTVVESNGIKDVSADGF